MSPGSDSSWLRRPWVALPAVALTVVAVLAFTRPAPDAHLAPPEQDSIVLRGRALVMEHACGGCHGGADPASDGWLGGWVEGAPPELMDFHVMGFHTYARNLTPDNTTGLGRFSERQIFNSLRYGLRPGETPDVEITSNTPGEGNFPENPKYLAPPMPWPAWRHMPDEDLWAIAAYLKRGVKPVHNRVPDSEGPPDFWAEAYSDPALATYPAPAFPAASERKPPEGIDLGKVLRGRQQVIEHDCAACHNGATTPATSTWLIGRTGPDLDFVIGPCAMDPDAMPCFRLRPRNLTPDSATGVGRYSERQLFNALRYGLSPRNTPDVEITSSVPGQGNFPEHPVFLAPAMPWQYWRHMSDEDLWAIAAYLKYGLKPVSNEVEDSDAPPDFWASEYTVEKIGPYPPPPFPTENEIGG